MADVAVAFLWHQHQPYYPDDVAGENPMPWVRLHGVKDYYGMAMHLLEVPEMRCTINLVPSLLVQLQAYTDRGATDRFLDVSRRPADGLSEEDALFLLDHFFMANADVMIGPYPRYAELERRRNAGHDTARDALRRFGERELRDLQVWFNLTWIHPLAFEQDADLRALRDQGRHFSETDKAVVLEKQLGILRQVIPLHRQLMERGQVELTTTPFFHPILPLLFDKKLAREALPEIKLPHYTGGVPEDAEVHVRRAIEFHTQLFGQAPRGLWPAEGSVCQPMLPLLHRHGIRWLATDEEILSHSTQGFVSRDGHGHVRNPEHMYRPYRVAEGGHELSIVFRDHALSDMLGFHYHRTEAAAAADDFVRHLQAIGQAVQSDRPALVPVILDGENCWEHYAGGGVPFLRALYERCTRTPGLRPVQVGAFLEQHPPCDTLPHLFAGSWINHNFAIWIGHEEDNLAWDALHRAREHLRVRAAQAHVPPARLHQAWEELYIAEGSDWFWWYGDDHSSSQDALFDYLFRKHVQNAYTLLGDQPPADLSRPISRKGHRPLYTQPRSFLDVKIDGRKSFLQWLGAGHYTCRNERGTMAMVTHGPIKDLYFGFTLHDLLLRLDFDEPARTGLANYDALRMDFIEPAGAEVVVRPNPDWSHPAPQLRSAGEVVADADVRVAIDQVVELAIPFDQLGVFVHEPIQFRVELLQGEQSRDRAPQEGVIGFLCPSLDFERMMWDV